jgi:hypothetical protein
MAHPDQHAADAAAAQHGHRLTRLQACPPQHVHGDGERLDRAALGIGEMIRQAEHRFLRREDVLAEGARPRLSAQHLFGGAEVNRPCMTVVASSARPVRIHRHTIPDGDACHGIADSNHVAGHFVAQDGGWLAERVGAVKRVHFRTADPYRAYADEHLVVCPQLRCGDLLDGNVIL